MGKELIKFRAYGVRIGIECSRDHDVDALRERLNVVFPAGVDWLPRLSKVEHEFFLKSPRKDKYSLYQGRKSIIKNSAKDTVFDRLDSQLRITVAEFAKGWIFVHSGVVAFDGKAIMVPASSYKGKSTLVAELVRLGAIYYSDEYAILDEGGLVHPFPKMLSIRVEEKCGAQVDYPVEKFGGVAGDEAIPVGLVLITEYKKYAKWKPEILSGGQGILEVISHTVPIRNKPKYTFSVLHEMMKTPLVIRTNRGEAERSARKLVEFFNKNVSK